MTDVLFQCADCGKTVAAGDESLGQAFSCPGCGAAIRVPEPALMFLCTACQCGLSAPGDLRGRELLCPSCGERMAVPENTTVPCPGCGVQLELSDEDFSAMEGQTLECPECGAETAVPRRPRLPAQPADVEQRLPSGFKHKTLRIDKIIQGIPLAGALERGICPYCNSEVEKKGPHSYACERCGRLIKTVSLAMQTLRSARRKTPEA